MPRLTITATIPSGTDHSDIVVAIPTSSNDNNASGDADASTHAYAVYTALSSPSRSALSHSGRNLAVASATAVDTVAAVPPRQSSRKRRAPAKLLDEKYQAPEMLKKSTSKKQPLTGQNGKLSWRG